MLDALRAGRSMAEDAAVRLLMAFLFDYEQCRRPVGSLRGGERTRLAFLCLMQDAPNCLVLDEPTNHLDIDSIEALEDALERYDGTVIAVSHDRYFLDRIADRIVLVADGDGAAPSRAAGRPTPSRAGGGMIARSWRGAVRTADAEAYAAYIDETGMQDVRRHARQPRRVDAHARDRRPDRVRDFSLWDSYDADQGLRGRGLRDRASSTPRTTATWSSATDRCTPLGRGPNRGWLAWRAMSDASNGAGRPLVSVVVPVFNEAATVGQVVEELLALDAAARGAAGRRRLHGRLAGRARAARRAAHRRSRSSRSRRTGARAPRCARGITESTGDILLIQDADLEYSPSDIPALIDPLLTGKADAVFGTRLRGGAHAAARAPLLALRRQPLPDAARQRALQHDDLRHGGRLQGLPRRARARPDADLRRLPHRAGADGQGAALGPDIRLYEVPISYYGRSYAEGKKITWRDGFGAVGALVRFRFF